MGRPGQRLSKLSSQIFLFQVLILRHAAGRSAARAQRGAGPARRRVPAARARRRAHRRGDAGDRRRWPGRPSGVVQVRAEAVRRGPARRSWCRRPARDPLLAPGPGAHRGAGEHRAGRADGRTVLAVEAGTLGRRRARRSRCARRRPDRRAGIRRRPGGRCATSSARCPCSRSTPASRCPSVSSRRYCSRAGSSARRSASSWARSPSLLQEREATLHGIREGVVAVDPGGRVRW